MDKPVVNMDDEQHDAEIRLMGLILAQSALVGVAVGVFDADVWLKNDTTWLNGFTYAMGAFFVQGIAYYVFKMFFEQSKANATATSTYYSIDKLTEDANNHIQSYGVLNAENGVYHMPIDAAIEKIATDE